MTEGGASFVDAPEEPVPDRRRVPDRLSFDRPVEGRDGTGGRMRKSLAGKGIRVGVGDLGVAEHPAWVDRVVADVVGPDGVAPMAGQEAKDSPGRAAV